MFSVLSAYKDNYDNDSLQIRNFVTVDCFLERCQQRQVLNAHSYSSHGFLFLVNNYFLYNFNIYILRENANDVCTIQFFLPSLFLQ